MSTTTHIKWIVDSLTKGTYKVVRVTETVETLAGPFSTVGQAKRWLTANADQLDMFNQPADEPGLFS